MSFLSFWRLLMPISLGFLILLLFGADLFLVQARRTVESDLARQSAVSQSDAETEALKARALRFNELVASIKTVMASREAPEEVLRLVRPHAAENKITLVRVLAQALSAPVTLTGSAPTQEYVVAFKKALDNDSRFSQVNLPITDIRTDSQSVSFTMSFLIVASSTR